jgi:hypothetical protein
MAALEVGVSAAIAAWLTNWALLRRAASRTVATDDQIEPDAMAPAAAGSSGATYGTEAMSGTGAMSRTGARSGRVSTSKADAKAKADAEADAKAEADAEARAKAEARGKTGGWIRRRRGRGAGAQVTTGGQSGSSARGARETEQPAAAASRLQFVDPEPVLAPRRPARPIRPDSDDGDDGRLPDWVSEGPAPRGQHSDQGATIHVLRPDRPDRPDGHR